MVKRIHGKYTHKLVNRSDYSLYDVALYGRGYMCLYFGQERIAWGYTHGKLTDLARECRNFWQTGNRYEVVFRLADKQIVYRSPT